MIGEERTISGRESPKTTFFNFARSKSINGGKNLGSSGDTMNSISPEGLTEVVQRRALSYPAILSVYLFGSQSTGKAKPHSDLDLAILLFPGQENDFPLLELAVSLEKALNRSVDLVILNRAGELLKYQVRRNGRLLYERDPRLRKQFEVRGRKSFEDFLYLHRRSLGLASLRTA
jgi:predicted nucleotidyltransferase